MYFPLLFTIELKLQTEGKDLQVSEDTECNCIIDGMAYILASESVLIFHCLSSHVETD